MCAVVLSTWGTGAEERRTTRPKSTEGTHRHGHNATCLGIHSDVPAACGLNALDDHTSAVAFVTERAQATRPAVQWQRRTKRPPGGQRHLRHLRVPRSGHRRLQPRFGRRSVIGRGAVRGRGPDDHADAHVAGHDDGPDADHDRRVGLRP